MKFRVRTCGRTEVDFFSSCGWMAGFRKNQQRIKLQYNISWEGSGSSEGGAVGYFYLGFSILACVSAS